MSSKPNSRSPSQASSTSSHHGYSNSHSPSRRNTFHLTPDAFQNYPYSQPRGLEDPRSSSSQSLHPVESPGPNRRMLLVIYIHGFMGTETSFRSFPAHVHSLLTMTLSETHVVHTKIYPRYQSRKNISFARDAFSTWLLPHESEQTDVILVGHSLGGILGAEVVLMPSDDGRNLRHLILGLIAFDTPFLGMHPGVVSTGIASLFRGSPEIADEGDQTNNPPQLSDKTSRDPNFNPAFANDVNLPVWTNKWERAWHFLNKHAGDLSAATQSYVKSHLEFGGCLADYAGLRKRYNAIRSLEDVDDLDGHGRRVRFVNYYTASTGRIKEKKPEANENLLTTETEMQDLSRSSNLSVATPVTPRLSLEEHRDNEIVDKTEELEIDKAAGGEKDLQTLEPVPHNETELDPTLKSAINMDDLPAIPTEPIAPVKLDASQFTDADALRLAEKDHARQMKVYEKAKKSREKAIEERAKVIAKRERAAKKQQEKEAKRIQQESLKRQVTLNPEQQDRQMRDDAKMEKGDAAKAKMKKDRKFCSLPSKNQDGKRDPTWIRVYMEGMDEVVAHTSLFFVSETYAKLVGDTVERIEQWLGEDATSKLLRHDNGS